jgi:hypothetical protein
MKNRPIVQQLPDPPVVPQDVDVCLVITQVEIVALVCAHDTFQLARADFEMKCAAVKLKLLQHCDPAEGSYTVKLNRNGGLILTDESGAPSERKIIGDGDSHGLLLE